MKLSDKILSAFKGDVVSQADHDAALAKLSECVKKIEQLEAKLADVPNDDASAAAIDALTAKVAELEGKITMLEAEKAELTEKLKNPSAQAAAILSKAGAQNAPDLKLGAQDEGKDFAALVKIQKGLGKTEADAIRFCVKNFPAEYATWRK